MYNKQNTDRLLKLVNQNRPLQAAIDANPPEIDGDGFVKILDTLLAVAGSIEECGGKSQLFYVFVSALEVYQSDIYPLANDWDEVIRRYRILPCPDEAYLTA